MRNVSDPIYLLSYPKIPQFPTTAIGRWRSLLTKVFIPFISGISKSVAESLSPYKKFFMKRFFNK